MVDPAFLRSSVVLFAEAIAATPTDTPSVRFPNRTRRQVLMSAIEGAADVLGTVDSLNAERDENPATRNDRLGAHAPSESTLSTQQQQEHT